MWQQCLPHVLPQLQLLLLSLLVQWHQAVALCRLVVRVLVQCCARGYLR
jgi:hypothetical protein